MDHHRSRPLGDDPAVARGVLTWLFLAPPLSIDDGRRGLWLHSTRTRGNSSRSGPPFWSSRQGLSRADAERRAFQLPHDLSGVAPIRFVRARRRLMDVERYRDTQHSTGTRPAPSFLSGDFQPKILSDKTFARIFFSTGPRLTAYL